MRPAMQSDRGSVTLFVSVLVLAFMVVVALVLDGGRAVAARAEAAGIAAEAARAGTGSLDLDYLRATGLARLDPDAAQAAALAWMHQAGVAGTAVATTSEVTTTVTIDQTTKLFSLAGIDTITVEASATARPRLGVTEPIGGP